MASLTVENYLKATLQLAATTQSDWVSTGQLAAALRVTPGTVTSMCKTLAESGLAMYKPYSGVSLTKAGRALAIRILRRHRLIELFLVRTLDLTWDQVHDEAERMEHAVSDTLIDRIDAFLGHPETDPHGDPIPTAEGQLRTLANAIPLSACEPGLTVKVVRVLNQQADFLRYLTDNGLALGAIATVASNTPTAGIITVQSGGRTIALGHPAAENLLVKPESEPNRIRSRGQRNPEPEPVVP